MLLFVAITGFVVLAGLATGEEMLTGEFSRTFEEKEIFEGDEICIRYSLGFSGFRPRLVQLVQEFPEGMSLPPAQEYRIISGQAELEMRVRAVSRGKYLFPPCRLAVSDIAGLKVEFHHFGGEERILVSSRVQRIDVDAIQPMRPKTVTGNRISRYRGGGSDFYSLRKYMEGESVRRINWRASARSDELWVNEYLAESSGTQIIVLDARTMEDDRRLTKEMADAGIRAATSIAYSSLNDRNAVGMFIISDAARIIRPDYGARQFIRIGEALKNMGVPTSKGALNMQRMARVYGDEKAQYVVISPLPDDDTLDSVAELALSHEDVLVLVPLVSIRERANGPEEMALTVTRLRQETNAVILSQICRTLTWQKDSELSVAVGRAGMYQIRRRL